MALPAHVSFDDAIDLPEEEVAAPPAPAPGWGPAQERESSKSAGSPPTAADDGADAAPGAHPSPYHAGSSDGGAKGHVWMFMHDIRKVGTGGKCGRPNYDDMSAWTKYDAETAAVLEAAYRTFAEAKKPTKKQRDVAVTCRGTEYVVCFSDDDGKMRQWQKGDTRLQRPVQRRVAGDVKAKGEARDTPVKGSPKKLAAKRAGDELDADAKRARSEEAEKVAAPEVPRKRRIAPPAQKPKEPSPSAEEEGARKRKASPPPAAAVPAPAAAAPPPAAPATAPRTYDWMFMHDIRKVKAGLKLGVPNYEDLSAWTKYDDEVNAQLEAAYQRWREADYMAVYKKVREVDITSGGCPYTVTFRDADGHMRQWRKGDEGRTRPVQRRERAREPLSVDVSPKRPRK